MSLTSSSTLEDAKAQYNDNLLWEGDTVKAQNCLEAIRFLLANRPARQAQGEHSWDFESLKDQETQLRKYLNTATSTIGRAAFTVGRMAT